MRKAKGRPSGSIYTFIPTAFDNHKDSDPVTFHLKAPNDAQRRDIVLLEANSMHEHLKAVKKAVLNHVIKVENYQDTTGQEIKDAKDLLTHGETQFLLEIYQELVDSTSVTEAQKKE